MSVQLTDFQKRLCNRLQEGLPLCPRPFAEIAEELDSTESDVLRQMRALQETGILRRVSAVINHRALGMSGTLVTAHVAPGKLDAVTSAVNALPGVSHNYLRRHHYNLWFTLQEKTAAQIHVTLHALETRLGVVFHSLPVARIFKLDVRFDAEGEDELLVGDVPNVPSDESVKLRTEHKQLLATLPSGLAVTSRPFDALRPAGVELEDLFALLDELMRAGVIRRIAAVLDQRRLGFTANVMFAGEVSAEAIVAAGRRLARFNTVSHCYERRTFEGWPYNLFAMMHARSAGQIQRTVARFAKEGDVRSHALLPTEAELKKQPVRYELS